MATVFEDRKAVYPNRYKVIPDSGSPYYVTLERADAPSTLGTPLNAATFNGLVNEINTKIDTVTTQKVGQAQSEISGWLYELEDSLTALIESSSSSGVRFESGSCTLSNYGSYTFKFTGTVKVVIVTADVGSGYTMNGVWTPATSGKINGMYGLMPSGASGDFPTTVIISGSNATVERNGDYSVKYYVTAIVE